MVDFIQEYFLNPLQHPELYPPYNPVNTITFAILALLGGFILYKGLKKLGVKYDEDFFFGVLPYIVFAAIVRVIVDADLLPRSFEIAGFPVFLLVTPGIYITTLAIIIAALLVSLKTKTPMVMLRNIGIALSVLAFLPLLTIIHKIHLDALIIPILAVALTFSFGFVYETITKNKLGNVEKALFFGQVFDGSSTFYGIDFKGYGEQHVVGNVIIDAFGTAFAFLIVKILFAATAIYFLQKEKNGEEKTFVALILTIVGLGPGARGFFRILFNT